jgi:hypothetical protein
MMPARFHKNDWAKGAKYPLQDYFLIIFSNNYMLRFLLWCCLPVFAWGNCLPDRMAEQVADQVLNKLYQANGNFIFLKPRIEWSTEVNSVAAFKRRTNTIVLEEKAYNVCRSFGKDSLSALAFILGHELAHAYQEEGWNLMETNFLAQGYAPNSTQALEKSADIGGVFMAYLGGYRTADMVPELLERLYDVYALKGKPLAGYPSLTERMASGREVQALTRELISVFETGALLSAAGQYELSDACYSYVEQFYKGREVYNNIGVNKSLYALNFTELTLDKYAYPFELEWHTRLKKPRAARGEDDLTEAQRMMRRMFLTEARTQLETARKMNRQDFTAELNLFCVTMLLDGAPAALQYYEQAELQKNAKLMGATTEQQEKLQLAVGIAWAQNSGVSVAGKIWTDLAAQSAYPGVRQLAQANLSALNGQPLSTQGGSGCTLPFAATATIDGIRLNRPPLSEHPVTLRQPPLLQMGMVTKPGSTVLTFLKNGKVVYALQRISYGKTLETMPRGDTALPAEGGTLQYCAQDKVLLRVMGTQLRLEEWVKVWGF